MAVDLWVTVTQIRTIPIKEALARTLIKTLYSTREQAHASSSTDKTQRHRQTNLDLELPQIKKQKISLCSTNAGVAQWQRI